jgi:hypothetical protein
MKVIPEQKRAVRTKIYQLLFLLYVFYIFYSSIDLSADRGFL